MENILITVAGLFMGFYAWKMALGPVQLNKVAALGTAVSLVVVTICYIRLGLITAALTTGSTALAWSVISWKAIYGQNKEKEA